MIDWPTLLVAFSIGILGGAHCIGMCGGIMGALTMAVSVERYRQKLLLIIAYNLGRIISYLFIAWVFYQLVSHVEDYFALQFMRYVAGCLLITMGLYLADWWRGLLYLEKWGAYLWRLIQPLSRSFLPVKSYHHAFFLGVIWGWLPCGLIYSALAYSTAADSSANAVLTMLAFAVGTLPALLSSGLLAERLLVLVKKTKIRQGFAVVIILFGIWTLYQVIAHSEHHHAVHGTPSSSSESTDPHAQHHH